MRDISDPTARGSGFYCYAQLWQFVCEALWIARLRGVARSACRIFSAIDYGPNVERCWFQTDHHRKQRFLLGKLKATSAARWRTRIAKYQSCVQSTKIVGENAHS